MGYQTLGLWGDLAACPHVSREPVDLGHVGSARFLRGADRLSSDPATPTLATARAPLSAFKAQASTSAVRVADGQVVAARCGWLGLYVWRVRQNASEEQEP